MSEDKNSRLTDEPKEVRRLRELKEAQEFREAAVRRLARN